MERDLIIRIFVLILMIINQLLIVYGKNPLPYSEEEFYKGVSAIFMVLSVLWTTWKNNSFTEEAKEADRYLKKLRNTGNTTKGVD